MHQIYFKILVYSLGNWLCSSRSAQSIGAIKAKASVSPFSSSFRPWAELYIANKNDHRPVEVLLMIISKRGGEKRGFKGVREVTLPKKKMVVVEQNLAILCNLTLKKMRNTTRESAKRKCPQPYTTSLVLIGLIR